MIHFIWLILYFEFFYPFFSWLFEELSRDEAITTLQNQTDGTFLVRPSSTIKGDLVLCVKYVILTYDFRHTFESHWYSREGSKVSHYIINVTHEPAKSIYKIGDKTFPNMKDLLNFYKQRLLDTSPLTRIVCFLFSRPRNSSSSRFSIPNLKFEPNTNSTAK